MLHFATPIIWRSPTITSRYLQAFTVIVVLLLLFVFSWQESGQKALLALIGVGLGMSLFHAAFGFAGAYRRAIEDKDLSGIAAQIIMLAAAMLLFAPILSDGQVLGRTVGGALAPVSISMAIGAFIFGIGMQMAGGCASGVLFTSGGGSGRMAVVTLFFCLGAFWGSLDLAWWTELPGIGSVSIAETLGWVQALLLQLAVLAGLYFFLKWLGFTNKRPIWGEGMSVSILLTGPWPLVFSAGMLALLNLATLVVAGHPWSVTWGFTLWGAKLAVLAGWDPMTSSFWSSGFPYNALQNSIFADTTSVMNFGIVGGAMLAAFLSGKLSFRLNLTRRSFVSAVIGGLVLGYGARLAYGCNIGAFFSGVASFSLHGWVWIIAAFSGNYLALRVNSLVRIKSTV